jgi:hypothetical protein
MSAFRDYEVACRDRRTIGLETFFHADAPRDRRFGSRKPPRACLVPGIGWMESV